MLLLFNMWISVPLIYMQGAVSYSIHGMIYTHDCIIEDLYPYPFLCKPPITIYFYISFFLDTLLIIL